jgi:glycosyltransferase involved in cell wall biosynthesis
MTNRKLSIVTIAKNEEKMLGECLETVAWADEVILVDTGSVDKTIDIAKRSGAKVVDFGGSGTFSDWRNRGIKEASGEWVLYVDADERVTPGLKKEIESRIRSNELGENAYAIPRRNFIFGKEFRHGGQWPDYVKRLFKKSQFRGWSGSLHEEPKFAGDMGQLKSPLIHIKHESLSEMVEKTNGWSEIEAKLMLDAHHPPMNILRLLSAMAREFWLRFIREFAFLDGTEGVIYGLYQVYSRSISYAKLWEMQLKGTK